MSSSNSFNLSQFSSASNISSNSGVPVSFNCFLSQLGDDTFSSWLFRGEAPPGLDETCIDGSTFASPNNINLFDLPSIDELCRNDEIQSLYDNSKSCLSAIRDLFADLHLVVAQPRSSAEQGITLADYFFINHEGMVECLTDFDDVVPAYSHQVPNATSYVATASNTNPTNFKSAIQHESNVPFHTTASESQNGLIANQGSSMIVENNLTSHVISTTGYYGAHAPVSAFIPPTSGATNIDPNYTQWAFGVPGPPFNVNIPGNNRVNYVPHVAPSTPQQPPAIPAPAPKQTPPLRVKRLQHRRSSLHKSSQHKERSDGSSGKIRKCTGAVHRQRK